MSFDSCWQTHSFHEMAVFDGTTTSTPGEERCFAAEPLTSCVLGATKAFPCAERTRGIFSSLRRILPLALVFVPVLCR